MELDLDDSFDSPDVKLPEIFDKKEYVVGDLVVYEFLDTGTWEWGIGRITLRTVPRLVTLHLWQPKERALSAADHRRAEAMMREIQLKTAEAEKKRQQIEEQASKLEQESARIILRQREVEEQIAEIQPSIDQAKKALNAITSEHIREMRGYATPPPMVRRVLEAVLTVLKKDQSLAWDAVKTFVRRDDFIPTVRDYDASVMTEETRQNVEKQFLSDSSFTQEAASRASKVAGPLYQWIVVQLKYAAIMKKILPQKKELEGILHELHLKESKMDAAKNSIADLETGIKKLKKQYDEIMFGVVEAKKNAEIQSAAAINFSRWIPSQKPPCVILNAQILCCCGAGASVVDFSLSTSNVAVISAKKSAAIEPAPNPLEGVLKQKNEELDDINDDLMERVVEISVQKQAVQKLTFELEEEKDERKELEARIQDLQEQLQAERQKLTIANFNLEELEESKELLELEIEKLKSEILRLKELIEAMKKDQSRNLEKSSGDEAALLAEIEKLKEKIVMLERELSDERGQTRMLQERIEELLRELDEARKNVKEVPVEVVKEVPVEVVKEIPRAKTPKPETLDAAVQTDEVQLVEPPKKEEPKYVDPLDDILSPKKKMNTPPAEDDDDLAFIKEEKVEERTVLGKQLRNPVFLAAAFEITKVVSSALFSSGKKLKRIWLIDQFAKHFHNVDGTKMTKSYSSTHMIMLEKHPSDPLRLTLLFFGRDENHELIFSTPYARERFYELAQAMRPTVNIYAPDFAKIADPTMTAETIRVTIGCKGTNAVNAKALNISGNNQPINRTLEGECQINVSRKADETFSVWVGTATLNGKVPCKDGQKLNEWIPKGMYDLYAIAVHGISYNGDHSPNDWNALMQAHLGKGYQQVATICISTNLSLVVFTRTRHLTKIVNIEGSQVAVGPHGGCGVSFKVFDTSYCFVAFELPFGGGEDGDANRKRIMFQVLEKLQLGSLETDFSQFHNTFLFGNFGYGMSEDAQEKVAELVQEEDFDALLDYDTFDALRQDEGILKAFREPEVAFAPTAFTEEGPAYPSRILYHSREIKERKPQVVSYEPASDLVMSVFAPVSAVFTTLIPRPSVSFFAENAGPVPKLKFENITIQRDSTIEISKPLLMMESSLTTGRGICQCSMTKTISPQWNGDEIPPLEFITQVLDSVERCIILLVLRDHAALSMEQGLIGTGSIPLFGRIHGKQGVEQTFDVPIITHGKACGRCAGKFTWDPSANGESKLLEGVYLTPSLTK